MMCISFDLLLMGTAVIYFLGLFTPLLVIIYLIVRAEAP